MDYLLFSLAKLINVLSKSKIILFFLKKIL